MSNYLYTEFHLKELLRNITSYHIFNHIFPGAIFAVILRELAVIDIMRFDIFYSIVSCYFLGMVISRIGSLIIEPIFKKLKMVYHADYVEFNLALKENNRIEILSEINNVYRTLIALALVTLILIPTIELINYYEVNEKEISIFVLIFLILIFSLSYRKQTSYINKLVSKKK